MAPTPILDRLQPPPPTAKPQTIRSLVIGAVIGAALGLLVPRLKRVVDVPVEIVWALVPAYYLVILVHELGHLGLSLAAGFEFREISVGPFLVSRMATGWRVRLVLGRALAGGHVLAVPRSAHQLRRRFQIVLSGGPLATALLFAVLTFLPMTPFTGAMWLWNAMVAASSWIPFYKSGSVTDAKALLILGRRGREGDWLAATLYLVVLDRQGVLPRDWPADVVAQLASDGASPPAAQARYFTMIHALDIEAVLATSHLLRPDLRRVCFSEAAFHQGVRARDADRARGWLEDARAVKAATSEKGWDEGLLAAVARAEGREEAAREHARGAIAYLDRWPAESGSVAAARKRLAAIST